MSKQSFAAAPTPRTDDFTEGRPHTNAQWAYFCRQLERELAEEKATAREANDPYAHEKRMALVDALAEANATLQQALHDRYQCLRELAEAKQEALELAKQIDPFDTNDATYQLLRKYILEMPEKHPMEKP